MKNKLWTGLALALLLAVLCCGAATAESGGTCGDSLTWTLSDNGTLTISGTGTMTDYSSGGAPWYDSRESITSVRIENGVESIGNYAFQDLTRIAANPRFPSSMKTFGNSAFQGCSNLQSITISKGTTSIGRSAFRGCSKLERVIIPETVTEIDYLAFSNCSALARVHILTTGATIGDGDYDVFDNCPANMVMYGYSGSTAQTYAGNAGITFVAFGALSGSLSDTITWTFDPTYGEISINGTGAIPDYHYSSNPSPFESRQDLIYAYFDAGITHAGNWLFDECHNLVSAQHSLNTIGTGAFYNTGLTYIDLNNVTQIGNSAFYSCDGLTSAVFSSAESIGDSAFSRCTGLTSIEIRQNSASISGSVFLGCENLQDAFISGRAVTFGEDVFYGCSSDLLITGWTGSTAETYATDHGIEFKGLNASGKCGDHVTWTLDDTGRILTLSGTGATWNYDSGYPGFYDANGVIKGVVIEEGITALGSWLFYNMTAVTDVSISDSVTVIGASAFNNCSALDYSPLPISRHITTIGARAFYNCSRLGSVNIFNPSVSIGSYAFDGCKSGFRMNGYSGSTAQTYAADNGITFNAWPVSGTCGDQVNWSFKPMTGKLTITGTGMMEDFSIISQAWGGYTSQVVSAAIGKGVTSIGSYAFFNCQNLTSISLPATLTKIGRSAFSYCKSMSSISIPGNVTDIDKNAFCYCTGLKSATLSEGVVHIRENAFEGCAGLKSITIPGSVQSMYENVFIECTGLTSVVIRKGTSNISKGAFYGCTKLKNITIPDSVTSIDAVAFSGCTSLASVTIPNSVTNIDYFAFMNCTALTAITIPASVTTIGNQAFSGCSKLADAFIYNMNPVLGIYLFYNCKPGLIIHGWPYSAVKDYANTNSITFQALAVPAPDFFLPAGLKTIGGDTSYGIKAKAVVIPKTVTSIIGNPFADSGVQVIYGYYGTAAETLATNCGYYFIGIDDEWMENYY